MLFQGNSAERCRDSNKIITLPLVLFFCVFDFYIIFCKYPYFSLILSAAEFDGRCLNVTARHFEIHSVPVLLSLPKTPKASG